METERTLQAESLPATDTIETLVTRIRADILALAYRSAAEGLISEKDAEKIPLRLHALAGVISGFFGVDLCFD